MEFFHKNKKTDRSADKAENHTEEIILFPSFHISEDEFYGEGGMKVEEARKVKDIFRQEGSIAKKGISMGRR